MKSHTSQEDLQKDQNLKYIISLDECGWGSLAGPLGLALCVLSVDSTLQVKDSKMYSSQKKREEAYIKVKEQALWSGVKLVPVHVLNKKGLGRAKDQAMFELILDAIQHFSHKDTVIILDGSYIPKVMPSELKNYRVLAVPRADAKIKACSAASVLGKVEHDRAMDILAKDTLLQPYEFDRNKGYGSPNHLEAIKELGITAHHRLFCKPVIAALAIHNKKDCDE